MIVIFDQYYKSSTAASALILKERVNEILNNTTEEVVLFCSNKSYKQSSLIENEKFEHRVLDFKSYSKTLVEAILFIWKNKKSISYLFIQSSPGYNLFILRLLPRSVFIKYVVQDVFPDNLLFIKNLTFLIQPLGFFIRWFYKRINEVYTISKSMSKYLEETYNLSPTLLYNPLISFGVKASKGDFVEKKINLCYSGNFSYSHGYEGPKLLVDEVTKNYKNLIRLKFHGFGQYFDRISSEFPNHRFGGHMNNSEYSIFMDTSSCFLLFQEKGYERYVLSSKFNTLCLTGRPLFYIGSKCDISDYIEKYQIGVTIDYPITKEKIKNGLEILIKNYTILSNNSYEAAREKKYLELGRFNLFNK